MSRRSSKRRPSPEARLNPSPSGLRMRGFSSPTLAPSSASLRRAARAISSSSVNLSASLCLFSNLCESLGLLLPPSSGNLGHSRAKCPSSPHRKHPEWRAFFFVPSPSPRNRLRKCARSSATFPPMAFTRPDTEPHRSLTTSDRDLPSSNARSLARRSAFRRQLAPPSPTPPDAPAVSRALEDVWK